jgi:hypothetical protein
MGAGLSRTLHTTTGLFGVHIFCAIAFAIVYSVMNAYVVEELVRRAMASDSSPNERAGMRDAMDRSPFIRDVMAKERGTNHIGQQYVLGLPVALDHGATLRDYQDRTFTYWLMNSILLQAGVGGGFIHLSNIQRLVVISQTVMVLAISAFSVAYGTI